MQPGARIEDEGVLLKEHSAIIFRRDAGGRFRLDLRRTKAELTSRRVRIIGVYVGDDLIDVDEIHLL